MGREKEAEAEERRNRLNRRTGKCLKRRTREERIGKDLKKVRFFRTDIFLFCSFFLHIY